MINLIKYYLGFLTIQFQSFRKMTKSHRAILFLTFLISVVSAIVTIVSLYTEDWVLGNAKSVNNTDEKIAKPIVINYGLFSGIWSSRQFDKPIDYNIALICIYSSNACGFVQKESLNEGEKDLRKILDGTICKKEGKEYNGTDQNNLPDCDEKFINAGLWISTLIFLALSLFFSGLAGIFGALNTKSNPIYSILNVSGLYFWNGGAVLMVFMTLIMWGSLFGVYISHNLAYVDILKGEFTSDHLSHLGYSYWILLIPFFLHSSNIGLLFLRQYLINKEPPPFKADIMENDGTMVIY